MTSDSGSEILNVQELSFWERQFVGQYTESQLIFDVALGVIAPILCFYLDPIVFKGNLMGRPLLQNYQLFAYGVSVVEVSLLTVWILFGARLGDWSGLVGGVLLSGAVFSAVIGLAILPYTLMGLIVVIGILGVTPFLTAFVYLRAGWRAFQKQDRRTGSLAYALLAGAILSLAIPALVSVYVSRTTSRSIDIILHGTAEQAELAVAQLRWQPFIPDENLEVIVQAYGVETDAVRREILKNSYQALTGDSIEVRRAILAD
jgi:hypothetical protein